VNNISIGELTFTKVPFYTRNSKFHCQLIVKLVILRMMSVKLICINILLKKSSLKCTKWLNGRSLRFIYM